MFYNMPECTYKFIVPLICESYQLVKEVLNFIQTKVGRDASPISIAQFQNRRRDGGDGGYFPSDYKKSQLANS